MIEVDGRLKEFNGIRWAYDRYEIIVDGIVNGVGVVFALIGAIVGAALWIMLLALGILTLGFGFALMATLPAVPLAYHVLFVAGRRHATPGHLGLSGRRHIHGRLHQRRAVGVGTPRPPRR